MNEDIGARPIGPGSREPSPAVSAASGFDPSRLCPVLTAAKAMYATTGSSWYAAHPGTRESYRKLARAAISALEGMGWAPRDSDGSPKGGDACGSVHDSAGPKDIAQVSPGDQP